MNLNPKRRTLYPLLWQELDDIIEEGAGVAFAGRNQVPTTSREGSHHKQPSRDTSANLVRDTAMRPSGAHPDTRL